jgi:hypothetical protein
LSDRLALFGLTFLTTASNNGAWTNKTNHLKSLPEDEQDLIYQLEGEGRELSEQERNLAITQAKLIGDL